MYNKLIGHIMKKLEDKGEIQDDFDIQSEKQIKYIMLATIEIVNEECQQCFYCKNYKRFSLRSLCKIKPHTQSDCFHFTLDVNKVLKKKYYHIMITVGECTRGQYLIDKYISRKTIRNIIYESIRIFESLNDFRIVNNIDAVDNENIIKRGM